jgi:hypothetical protein
MRKNWERIAKVLVVALMIGWLFPNVVVLLGEHFISVSDPDKASQAVWHFSIVWLLILLSVEGVFFWIKRHIRYEP